MEGFDILDTLREPGYPRADAARILGVINFGMRRFALL